MNRWYKTTRLDGLLTNAEMGSSTVHLKKIWQAKVDVG